MAGGFEHGTKHGWGSCLWPNDDWFAFLHRIVQSIHLIVDIGVICTAGTTASGGGTSHTVWVAKSTLTGEYTTARGSKAKRMDGGCTASATKHSKVCINHATRFIT